MDNKIPAIVKHCNQAILLTSQLAEGYQTTDKNIRQDFERNRDKFKLGKHYFFLEGQELAEFKKATPQFEANLKFAPSLLLWTKKGALLIAKSVNTDVAWQVYEELVDFYFEFHENNVSGPDLQDYEQIAHLDLQDDPILLRQAIQFHEDLQHASGKKCRMLKEIEVEKYPGNSYTRGKRKPMDLKLYKKQIGDKVQLGIAIVEKEKVVQKSFWGAERLK